MRILIVNPNSSGLVTDMLLREGRQAAAPGTEICAVTSEAEVSVVRTAADGVRAANAVVSAFDSVDKPIDAGIVGGFIEPGLTETRARTNYPVTGLGEASLDAACRMGKRFAVLTADAATVPGIEALVERHGRRARLAAILSANADLLDIARDQISFDVQFRDLAQTAAQNGADAVILGGAVFVGMAKRIGTSVSVPLIDPIHAAVWVAERRASGEDGS